MNSEKNSIKQTTAPLDIFIDVGNQLIKIGYLSLHQQWIVLKLPSKQCTVKDLDLVFNNLVIKHIYFGSVVSETTSLLIKYFTEHNYPHTLITNSFFINKVQFVDAINLAEVGTDILAFAYLIKEHKETIAINFGTATVAIYYNECIKGVSIGIDFFNSYHEFLKNIKLDVDLGTYNGFGLNTKDAIDSSRYFLINGYINEILKKYPTVKTLIFTGGNRRIFNAYVNEKNIEIIEIDEAVLKGYKRLIYGD